VSDSGAIQPPNEAQSARGAHVRIEIELDEDFVPRVSVTGPPHEASEAASQIIRGTRMQKPTERILAFTFGTVFVVVLLVLAVAIKNPTEFQYLVFRIVLALAAAGVAITFTGFLTVNLGTWIKAGGALAVFILVYTQNPANLVTPPPAPLDGLTLEKISGDAQLIPAGTFASFAVRVVDAKKKPVSGAKVLWQTPAGGDKSYVSVAGNDGIATATNLYAFPNPGSYLQTATLVEPEAPIGFVTAASVKGTSIVAAFNFTVPSSQTLRNGGALYGNGRPAPALSATSHVRRP
jgi:hypothetical protein